LIIYSISLSALSIFTGLSNTPTKYSLKYKAKLNVDPYNLALSKEKYGFSLLSIGLHF